MLYSVGQTLQRLTQHKGHAVGKVLTTAEYSFGHTVGKLHVQKQWQRLNNEGIENKEGYLDK